MPITNRFATHTFGITAPALGHFDGDAVKSDTVDLPEVCREIYVGVGGDVKVTDTTGASVTFKNAASGSCITGFFARLWSTGTTAASIVVGI